jgi:hypothetical protein
MGYSKSIKKKIFYFEYQLRFANPLLKKRCRFLAYDDRGGGAGQCHGHFQLIAFGYNKAFNEMNINDHLPVRSKESSLV